MSNRLVPDQAQHFVGADVYKGYLPLSFYILNGVKI